MPPFLAPFADMTDPRKARTRLHEFIDVLGIALCATLAGCEGWDAMHDFAADRIDWLKKFLALENGIPSADTIRRVISRIDHNEFQRSFGLWVSSICPKIAGVVAIDGKTVRNKRVDNPLHLVSAWAVQNGGLCLGQQASAEKSNEITAIPKLLELLDINGCLVTIDAMGCQKEIARTIVEENEANFCLAVKGNQPKLMNQLEFYFEDCRDEAVNGARKASTSEENRGRIETRIAYLADDLDSIPSLSEWPHVKCYGKIISRRTIGAETSENCRYFISSASLSAGRLLDAVRSHWQIENSLHWVLDCSFAEDGSRMTNHAQENLSFLRKVCLNLLKQEKSTLSIKRKIMRAARSEAYMSTVLEV